MDHALVADESSRLLACTLLRRAADDPTPRSSPRCSASAWRWAIRAAAACRQRLRALLETLFPGALDDTSAELEALRPQLQAYEARGLDDPQPGFRCCCACCWKPGARPSWTPPAGQQRAHARLPAPDHLWRDLGLSGREDVTALLTRHYPGLAARNVRNLRWKQYLAYAACEHAGLPPAAAPGCPGCEDHEHCYGGAAA